MGKYKIIIYWSNEDQAFVADVPELPGCMAHGETQKADVLLLPGNLKKSPSEFFSADSPFQK